MIGTQYLEAVAEGEKVESRGRWRGGRRRIGGAIGRAGDLRRGTVEGVGRAIGGMGADRERSGLVGGGGRGVGEAADGIGWGRGGPPETRGVGGGGGGGCSRHGRGTRGLETRKRAFLYDKLLGTMGAAVPDLNRYNKAPPIYIALYWINFN